MDIQKLNLPAARPIFKISNSLETALWECQTDGLADGEQLPGGRDARRFGDTGTGPRLRLRAARGPRLSGASSPSTCSGASGCKVSVRMWRGVDYGRHVGQAFQVRRLMVVGSWNFLWSGSGAFGKLVVSC